MKPVSPELEALLETGVFAQFELYTITLFGGGVLRFTNCQVNIAWMGNTWDAHGVRVDPKGSRSKASWKIGMDVDSWPVTVLPRIQDPITGAAYPDTINGVPWVAAAAAGALDDATFEVSRAFFAVAPGYPLGPGNAAAPVGIMPLFIGFVGPVDIGDTTVSITGVDFRYLLSVQLPRNVFRASCRFTLFDTGCQLVAASFAVNGTAIGGTTQGAIASTIGNPAGSGSYALGHVVMTSGLNATFARGVRTWSGGVLGLLLPFPYPIIAGDTFTAYPGCDKAKTTCTAFANLANYGGQPDIPTPETAI